MTKPSDDEGLYMVRSDKPEPKLLYSAVSKAEPQMSKPEAPEPFTFFTLGRLGIAGGIVVFVAFLVGSGYLLRQLHREAGLPEAPASAISATVPSSAALASPSPPVVAVTSDMLHVTSIALGKVHLAVVNGKRLSEGDRLDVTTPSGITTLQVMSIDDGIVRFNYGGQMIDAKLAAAVAQKKPH